jgi:hypothetical protein
MRLQISTFTSLGPSTLPVNNRKIHYKLCQPAPRPPFPLANSCVHMSGRWPVGAEGGTKDQVQEPVSYHSHSSSHPYQLPAPTPTPRCPAGGLGGRVQEPGLLFEYVDVTIGNPAQKVDDLLSQRESQSPLWMGQKAPQTDTNPVPSLGPGSFPIKEIDKTSRRSCPSSPPLFPSPPLPHHLGFPGEGQVSHSSQCALLQRICLCSRCT